jgi:NADPH:quinone reductase-like Zn-dependent oxidoreductase
MSFAEAAAVPVAGLTALYALRRAGRLLGRRVLGTGASGGVGGWAVQLASRGGAQVTALTPNTMNAQALHDRGAGIVTTPADLPAQSVDIVIGGVGGDTFTAAMARLGPDGIGVCVGNASGCPLAGVRQQNATFRIMWISVFREIARFGDSLAPMAVGE